MPLITLAGYTKAGKSTLLNALTDAGVSVRDRLFAGSTPIRRWKSAVGGLDGNDGKGKAEVKTQRRAMGHILGNAVRLTPHDDILVVGEGIETMLSLVEAVPGLPVWAALSSGHLGAVQLPDGLQRLYIAIDRDPAGQRAAERLTARATEVGIAVRVLEPRLGDFNDDLRAHGAKALRQHLAEQIDPKDQHRLTI